MKSLTAELADHGRFMGPRHVPPPKRGPHRAAQWRGTTPGLRWIDPRTGGEQPGDSQSEDHSSITRPSDRPSAFRYTRGVFRYGPVGGEGETIGRSQELVDGAVRTRAGQSVGGVGTADVAGFLAGRPDPGGVDEPGGRVGGVPGL